MTNTTPTQTLSGIVCGKCSTGFGKDRVVVRHAGVAEVRACFSAPVAPVVEVPTPAQMAAVFEAPEAKPFKRWSAKCPRTGCDTHAVKDHPFILKCWEHGKRPVRTQAKQLFGKVSTAAKHHCDDRCISAKGNICVCQCGGANHGVGLLFTFA